MRLLLALVFVLGLALQVVGQLTPSSVSAAAPSATGSGTASATITPTQSYPTPDAPINLDNRCKGHIINICPEWEDPPGFVFGQYRVYVTAQGSGIVQSFTLSDVSLRITNTLPQTLYDVWVQGQDGNGVWSFNSTVVTMTTDPADPKYDPTRDIQGFTCARSTNPKNNRVAAVCSWTPALDTVRQINYKVHCVSAVREPTLVRRRVYGATAATATSAFFAIHRDIGTCTFKARFYYARRATTRHSFTLTF